MTRSDYDRFKRAPPTDRVPLRTGPTIGRVLSDSAVAGMASSVEPAVHLAHRAGLSFRLTEFNSVTCSGLPGVSNAFATALWAPDAVFELLRVGIQGINLHARELSVPLATLR